MADNVSITSGAGTTIAADDIGGVKHQRVKLSLGADGTAVDAGAGAGAVGTDTQRVTLASDDPAVVALQALDNAVSGSELQVDVVAALPAGTNNIGDVDVLSMVQPDITQSGSLSAGSLTNTLTIGDGISAVALRISGTWVGTVVFEGSVDATLWDPIYGVRAGVGIPYTSIDESLNDNVFRFTTAGFRQVRAVFTRTSGTVTLSWRASYNVSGVYVNFPLPPGTNAIGKLAANSGVDIGDVDVLSLVPGTSATNLGKAIDTAAGATDTGVAALVVRDDALTTLTPADGDFVAQRVDSIGALWTRDTDPATGTTSAVADAATSTTVLASNAARRGATIWNDSTAVLYLLLGSGTASATNCTVKLIADAFYEVPFGYTGIISGIWASDASGSARVTEFT